VTPPVRARTPADAGFSLVELIVCLLFLALFTVAMQQFCRVALRGVRVLEAASEAQEAARLATQLIVADLREAGYSPRGALANGMRIAAADAVEVVRDLSGDGDVDDANERVGYRFDAPRGVLLRSQGGAPPQPFLSDIAPDGVRFRYLDAAGAPLEGAELADDARARVRRVAFEVMVQVPHPDPADGRPIRVLQSAVVSLRNG
jgi:hypothetical protein